MGREAHCRRDSISRTHGQLLSPDRAAEMPASDHWAHRRNEADWLKLVPSGAATKTYGSRRGRRARERPDSQRDWTVIAATSFPREATGATSRDRWAARLRSAFAICFVTRLFLSARAAGVLSVSENGRG
jgi:hypothetical protein